VVQQIRTPATQWLWRRQQWLHLSP